MMLHLMYAQVKLEQQYVKLDKSEREAIGVLLTKWVCILLIPTSKWIGDLPLDCGQ